MSRSLAARFVVIAVAFAVALSIVGCAHASPRAKADAKAARALPPCPTRVDADAEWRADRPIEGNVARICFLGSARWHAAQLRAAIGSAEGATFDRARIQQDLLGLYALGDLEDVRVYADTSEAGIVLVYAIRDRPRLAEVRFDGIDAPTEAALRASLRMGEMTSFDPVRMNDYVESIRADYRARGYARVSVTASTEAVPPDAARAVITIDAGPHAVVAKISFTGAAKIPRADLLRTIDARAGAPYRANAVDRDTLLLYALYYDRGMINAKVASTPAVVDPANGATALTFVIDEGDIFRIGALRIVGDLVKPERDYLTLVRAKPGQVFSRAALIQDIAKLTTFAKAQSGNAQTDVAVETDMHPDARTIDVVLRVGPKAP